MVRNEIHAAIKEEMIALGAPDAAFVVERPSQMEHGDYASNAALSAAKILKRNPREVAEEIIAHLRSSTLLGPNSIQTIEFAGAGFINFYLAREALMQEVTNAAQNKNWGTNNLYENKVVMVEYTDPNPFKEFHIGHLMSNAIGESIARLLESSGAEVIRANYQGDIGPHVAKAIWGYKNFIEKNPRPVNLNLGEKEEDFDLHNWGIAYQFGNAEYERLESEAKKEIDDINKKIYDKSDLEINRLYDSGRKVSLEHFEELYKILGTKFDEYFFESETGPKGLQMVKAHPELFEQSEGAIIFRGENYGLHTRVFVTKQGLPTYEAKDLGLIEAKRERRPFDFSIVVTASEQDGYFEVVLKAVEILFPDLAGTMRHVSHGMMRFASGKMSSRRGNVVTGESLLRDLKMEAKSRRSEKEVGTPTKASGEKDDLIAQQVAVGAIKYAVLKQGAGRDIVFDPEKSLSLEGDSGPYLQYAHTRALSLTKAAQKGHISPDSTDAPKQPTELERLLAHYPEVVERSAGELEPHYLTTYLTELASAFNRWYANTRVIGGDYPSYGTLLAMAVEQTLSKGLFALGIPAPEEM